LAVKKQADAMGIVDENLELPKDEDEKDVEWFKNQSTLRTIKDPIINECLKEHPFKIIQHNILYQGNKDEMDNEEYAYARNQYNLLMRNKETRNVDSTTVPCNATHYPITSDLIPPLPPCFHTNNGMMSLKPMVDSIAYYIVEIDAKKQRNEERVTSKHKNTVWRGSTTFRDLEPPFFDYAYEIRVRARFVLLNTGKKSPWSEWSPTQFRVNELT
jgi:hypothetical protein